ncbi:PPE domain-containing protein [Mycobacterium sp. 48b]|uniref:PPE domain-containing protein n=1 Tax=Mycobacterium sp. 48b TaxID=3400426 RepID=UPI003AACC9A9
MGAPGDKVQVTSSELTTKAESISTPRPQGPGPANPPDGLDITSAAMSQLHASVETLATTLSAGDVEAQRLAGALRAAAGAYDKVDADRKAALDGQMNGGNGETPAGGSPVAPDMSGIPEAPSIPCFAYPDAGSWDFFTDWQSAARTIHSGDTQALSVKYLRDQWKTYKQSLHEHASNFARPPAEWEGAAAESCAGSMQSLYGWWLDMGDEAERLGLQAEKFADAHDKLVGDHPTMEDVETFNGMNWSSFVPGAKAAQWAVFQTRSEVALREYANGTGLMQIRPGKPPSIGGLPAVNPGEVPSKPGNQTPGGPSTPTGGGGTGGGGAGGGTPEMPSVDSPSMSPASADPSAGQGSGGSPSGGSPSGGQGGGQPSGGSPSGGSPSTGGLPTGTEGMPEMPGLDDPSLKPASAGGGGGGTGGGGGGMGAGPLGPAVGAETVAASPSGSRGAGAGPAGMAGGAGAGGMGGGMGGMGGGHGQGGQGKEKRRNPNLTEDEDLYVEDRAYTEAVIGRRARKDAKDGK